MKYLILLLITTYQTFFSPILHQALGLSAGCRYAVSCSEYTKNQIAKRGVLSGTANGLKRVLSCSRLRFI